MYCHSSVFSYTAVASCQSESLITFFRRFGGFGLQSSCLKRIELEISRVAIAFVKLTSLDCSSLENTLLMGSLYFLWLLFELFESFLLAGGFRPRPLVPRRPTPLVSSSAANANKSLYCFWWRENIYKLLLRTANEEPIKQTNTWASFQLGATFGT